MVKCSPLALKFSATCIRFSIILSNDFVKKLGTRIAFESFHESSEWSGGRSVPHGVKNEELAQDTIAPTANSARIQRRTSKSSRWRKLRSIDLLIGKRNEWSAGFPPGSRAGDSPALKNWLQHGAGKMAALQYHRAPSVLLTMEKINN